MIAARPRGKLDARARRKALCLPGVIARDLGVLIVSGRYKPGDLLNGEVASSQRLHVSRGTYREAVRILSAKGLVEMQRRTGTKVTSTENWHWLDPDLLSWLFQFQPDVQQMKNFFELRRSIEPDAAALAALRRSPRQLELMRDALTAMDENGGPVNPGRAPDEEFRRTLFTATHNVYLGSMGHIIGRAVAIVRKALPQLRTVERECRTDYVRLLDAIVDSNSQRASQAMISMIDQEWQDALAVRGKWAKGAVAL